ncbi:DUF6779 domain-containing protein, partial [Rhodococcus sp. NPDC003318]|uniref:DUF6779 domain-containing protein n=1 Tax=Rhodococcus sp. NPDC003318 TaxID=3364503 RepID=UPI0036788F15
MTLSGRAGSIRRNKRSASQMIVAGLVALAVVASLFLIFSDSVQLLRIGLVAALWAAVIGAIAMTKYRRESVADKAKIRDLQTVYELQLEREISARREYEVGVETRVRNEVAADISEMAALRAELAALRGSLEVLFEGRLPVDRVAIAADGKRIGELGASPTARPAVPFAPRPAYTDPRSGPTFASPDDEPVTAEVSVVPDEPGANAATPPAAVPFVPPATKPERAKPEAVKTEPAKTQTVKLEAVKLAPVKLEAVKLEAAKTEAAKAEAAKAEAFRPAGLKVVGPKTEAPKESKPETP